MIISHKYHYLFIELPHTASTAISRELNEHYGGKHILHKHAHYHEFLNIAKPAEKAYFTFAGIRNPLDIIVTSFFKRKTNHQSFYTNPKYWQVNGGHVSNQALKEFHFLIGNDATFREYLFKFYRIPYDSWGSPRPDQFNFVIRYEYLQQDFSYLLTLLNIKQIRPLPIVNKTRQKAEDFWSYYSPDTYEHVQSIFGPYMKIWKYETPASWGNFHVSTFSYVAFKLFEIIRKYFIWRSPFCFYASLFRNYKIKSLFLHDKGRSE